MRSTTTLFSIFIAILILSCQSGEKKLFEELPASKTNIEFTNRLSESKDFNVLKYGYFYNGGGVAAGDFNNDGLIDLYFTGNLASNKLYLNKGEMHFEDISENAGVAANDGWNTGVSLVDINNDGFLDIYVCRSGAENPQLRKNLLFINNKNLTFTEKAAEYGLADTGYSTQAVFFDYDKDGDLDAFILNHSTQQFAGFSRMLGEYKKTPNEQYSSKLMRNDNGKFVDVSKEAGLVSNALSFGLGVSVADFNNDGWLDLYVSNDYNEEDYFYINQGKEASPQFKECVRDAMGHVSFFSMGSDAADLNNDGWIDLVTLDMLPEGNERIKMTSGDDNYDKYSMLLASGFHKQTMRNMLQLNNGILNGELGVRKVSTPIFSEIGQLAGISNTDWSWAVLGADYDLDGNKDLFITNGYARDYTNMDFLKFTMDEKMKAQDTQTAPDEMKVIEKMPSINEPNYIFRNKGDLTFENKQADWGIDRKMMSNGAIYADLDNDGDLDLVTNNINEKASIFQNNANNLLKKSFIKIALKAESQALMIGARVAVYAANKRQVQDFMPVRGFQSCMFVPLVFGLDDAISIDSVKITWNDNKVETLKNCKPKQTLVLDHAHAKEANALPLESKKIPSYPISSLPFIDQADSTNDFKIQPLLPWMPIVGPVFAKGDINGDGTEDLFIGGGKGQASKLFLVKNSNFIAYSSTAFEQKTPADVSAAELFDADGDKDLDLLIAYSNYAGEAMPPVLFLNDGKGKFSQSRTKFPAMNVGTIKAFDFDNDNKMDLFLGGKVVSGQYPKAPASILLKNSGKADFSPINNPNFTKLGMISDAVVLDFNNDKWQDLILVGEFTPLIFLENQQGKFVMSQTKIENSNGIWNKIVAEDFDNDGDKDLIVGNLGKNNQLAKCSDNGLILYAKDFMNTQQTIPVLCVKQNGKTYSFPARDELLDQIPTLKKQFTDYASFSKASIEEMLGNSLENAQKLEANTLETSYFENVKGKFIKRKLPIEAQFAPIYAIAVVDWNHDGTKDIVLGGNMNKARVRIGEMDANYGQVLLNNGKGNFEYLPQKFSGLYLKGDVRDFCVIGNTLVIGTHNQVVKKLTF